MVRHPSIVHTFKLEYLWGLLANLDQILYEASLGWGKGCIRFWGRLDQNFGFHGNRKCPLTYNGENEVSTFSLLFLIRSFSNLQVTRHKIFDEFEFRPDKTTPYGVRCPWASKKIPIDLHGVSKLACSFLIGSSSNLLVTRTGIKSQTNSGRIGSVTLELHALEGRLKFQYTYNGISHDQLANLDQILYVSSVGWGKGCS